MENTLSVLVPDAFYHIYNRANGDELMFKKTGNYYYFLNRYKSWIEPVAKTYCYCLMPNHFHLLVSIRNEEDILRRMTETGYSKLTEINSLEIPQDSVEFRQKKNQLISKYLSLQFSHLFNGYTQAFNKQHNRRGSLFMVPFKRKRIESEEYFRNLISYIHANPVTAGLRERAEDWEFSSYQSIVSQETKSSEKEEVINLFGDLENFVFHHRKRSGWNPNL